MTMDERGLVLLGSGPGEGRDLFRRLPFVLWQHRPLADDLSACFALPLHYVSHYAIPFNSAAPAEQQSRNLPVLFGLLLNRSDREGEGGAILLEQNAGRQVVQEPTQQSVSIAGAR